MEERIYIREAAKILDRQPHTIRTWEYNHLLPPELVPARDERGWRYWTTDQLEAIKRWIVDADIRPGSGLQGYEPDAKQRAQHLERIRASKRTEPAAQAA